MKVVMYYASVLSTYNTIKFAQIGFRKMDYEYAVVMMTQAELIKKLVKDLERIRRGEHILIAL